MEYLGHVLTPYGLKASSNHVEAVVRFAVPKSVKNMQQFLGLVSYYRRFFYQFSKVAAQLHRLTKKNVTFPWTEDSQVSFDLLKRRLEEAPILAYPDFEKEFLLETDACVQGLGAILSQLAEREVAYCGIL